MDILFLIGLALIFVGIFLVILSIILSAKKIKSDGGFVIVIWPFFIIGGNEKMTSILLIVFIISVLIAILVFTLR